MGSHLTICYNQPEQQIVRFISHELVSLKGNLAISHALNRQYGVLAVCTIV